MTLHVPCLQAGVWRHVPRRQRCAGTWGAAYRTANPHRLTPARGFRRGLSGVMRWILGPASVYLMKRLLWKRRQKLEKQPRGSDSARCGVREQLLHVRNHSQGPNPPTRGAGGELRQPNPTQPNLKTSPFQVSKHNTLFNLELAFYLGLGFSEITDKDCLETDKMHFHVGENSQ